MALQTPCQTPGAQFHTCIAKASVSVDVDLPFELDLTPEQAERLEVNLHNAIELALAPLFQR